MTFFFFQYYILRQLKTKTYWCACKETGIQAVKCLRSTAEYGSYSQEVSTNLLGQTEQMSVGILTLCITLIFITTRPDVYMFLGWKKKSRLCHPQLVLCQCSAEDTDRPLQQYHLQGHQPMLPTGSYTYGNLQPVSPATQPPKAHH